MVRIKKKELEIILQGLKGFDSPDPKMEQYQTPVGIASDILFTAKSLGDIEGKTVTDLGCGNGIFAIGAKLLGASEVLGIDKDPKVIDIARENASSLEIDAKFETVDIENFSGSSDTVLQNPPFGSQSKHADRPFLEKAFETGKVIYTIHMSETEEFIKREVDKREGTVTHMKIYEFEIKHTFDFHRKDKSFFDVTVFRIARG